MIKFKNINHVRDFIDLSDILSAIKALLKEKQVFTMLARSTINLIRIIKYFLKFYGKIMLYLAQIKNKLVADISKLKN